MYFCVLLAIITLVQQQKARFDSKIHGSPQKSPVRHKNAWFDTKCPPQHAPVDIAIINPPPPPRPFCEKYFFQNSFQYFVLRTNREMKMKLYCYEFKLVYSISLWKLKCNNSFLFVMAITSAAINKCYRYGRIFCQISAFSFDCSIEIWHARTKGLAHCWLNNALNKNFLNYSQ